MLQRIGLSYLGAGLIFLALPLRRLAERFVGGDVRRFLDTQVAAGAGDLCLALTGLGLALTLRAFRHRRRIFLRL